MKFLNEISEKTLVPVGFAIFLIGGAAAWMTSVDSRLSAHAARLDRQSIFHEEMVKELKEINRQLTTIETKLDSKRR